MGGEEMYQWFEAEVRREIPEGLSLSVEPTVTPGIMLGKIALSSSAAKALVKTDIRPEGVRLNFPIAWQQELSDWLGVPPAEAYRLKSNWVHLPSIGVATADHDPYFKQLAAKVIELLKKELNKA